MKKKKKKILLGSLITLVVLIAAAAIAYFVFIKMNTPSDEERIANNKARLTKEVDRQLKGIDTEKVKAKKDLIEQKSLADIKKNIEARKLSHEELVAYYLLRIKEEDQGKNGNNAVSEINPNAIKLAKESDKKSFAGQPLKGIPVLIKENINTKDLPTSAGAYALKDFKPATNAPVVNELEKHGAIILGKTNLSEMSNYMSKRNPNGYSAKNGQTHNPFDPLNASALGSSTGSAVAMATDLATVSFGTETAGSIVAPASVNSVVGFKPSKDAIDGEGVIPISTHLDTVGPIAKHVTDVVETYNAATEKKVNPSLKKDSLKGKRIGIYKMAATDEADIDRLKKLGKEQGFEVVVVEFDDSKFDLVPMLKDDFKHDVDMYLKKYNAPVKSLAEMVKFNEEDPEKRARYGQTYLEEALEVEKRDPKKSEATIAEAKKILAKKKADEKLDGFAMFDNQGSSIASLAHGPEVSVPFGKKGKVPTAVTFFDVFGNDENILSLAYSFEQMNNLRVLP